MIIRPYFFRIDARRPSIGSKIKILFIMFYRCKENHLKMMTPPRGRHGHPLLS